MPLELLQHLTPPRRAEHADGWRAQSDAASELLAKGAFGSMKQSANFISVTTWALIAAFIALSAVASSN
jgi:hypothetical protein